MKSHQDEFFASPWYHRFSRFAEQFDQRVDHHVADAKYFLRFNALPHEVFVGISRWREKIVADLIGQNAIDLLGHRTVPRSKAGLYMADSHPHFCRNQRGCDRRVHISVNQDQIRCVLRHCVFKANHDFGGLSGVRTRADFQVEVRPRHAQLVEKDLRHVGIIMLPGMNQTLLDSGVGVDRFDDRCRLHKVWTRADDVKEFHQESVVFVMGGKKTSYTNRR